MSYDIYCYKSKNNIPNIEEAEVFVNSENEIFDDETEKNKLADCLMKSDPTLERFNLDYNEIAKSQNITADEAKTKFNYIELTSPEGELPFQFTIENNNAFISVPYWYNDEVKTNTLFLKMREHLQSIYDCVGWHVYDPQTELVFLAKDFDLEKVKQAYLKGVGFIQEKVAGVTKKPTSNKKQIIIIAILVGLALLRVLLN